MRYWLIILCAALALWVSQPKAQFSSGALVVQTCGVLPLAYAIGSTRQLTLDTNGNTCQ